MPYVYDDVVGDVSVLVVRASEGVERDNIVTQQDFDKKGLFSFMHALHLFIGFFPYAPRP